MLRPPDADSPTGADLTRSLGSDAPTVDAPRAGVPPRALPARIGHYLVGDLLGRGGMGVVVRGTDTLTGEAVALKFLQGPLALDDDELQRVEREARLLSAVHHPHVGLMLGVEEHDGRPVLVLELIEGETLATRLARGALPLDEALAVAAQVASALEAAHARGIVHRDLKPANVKLTPRGDAKVLDFGIACRLDDAAPRSLASEAADRSTGGIAGSLGYMPPERLRGEDSGAAGDTWALGCLLYEMLTGRPAFPGRTAVERARRTLDDGVDLAALPDSTPPDVRALVASCLAPDPASRPSRGRDVLAALARAGVAAPPAATVVDVPAPDARPRLPRPQSTFVGRTEELASLSDATSAPGLVTLTGAGGSGKTRLALEAGLLVESGRGAIAPRRVTFVELALLPAGSAVAPHVATALGLPDAKDRDALASLVAALRGTDDVLLLDNCEHLPTAADLAAGLVASCPRLTILATSREPLRAGGERVVPLAPLSVPGESDARDPEALARNEAVALFVARAHAVRRSFRLDAETAPHVARCCRRLDGIPLAIELAAARVRSMPLDRLADALDESFAVVSGGSSAALPRHQALRATLDWSHELLDDPERELYRRLSVFAGPFTLALAERVGVSPGVAGVLERLVEKSLLQRTGAARTTWRLLEPVRQHAAERLAAAGEERSARRALLDALAATGREAQPRLDGSDLTRCVAELSEQHANLVAALHVAIEDPADDGADVGARLMADTVTYWITRGSWREGRAIVDRLHDEASPRLARSRASALVLSAQFSMLLGDSLLARERAERSAPLFREASDEDGLADALNTLSQIEWQMMNLPAARRYGEESLAIRRRLERLDMIANSLNQLGLIARSEGDLASARAYLDECVKRLRPMGNPHALGIALANVGVIALDQPDREAAARYLEEALVHARACGSRRGELFALANLGAIAFELGRADDCVAREREAAEVARELGDRSAAMTILWTLARLGESRGELERAATLQGAGLALREALAASRFLKQDRWDALCDRLREALGDARFDEAFERGRAMSLEEAMGMAETDRID